jgi:hypothetical protein
MLRALIVLCFAVGLSYPAFSQTSDKAQAELVAAAFLRGLDNGDLSKLYETAAGPTLKEQVSQEVFTESAGISRIQIGGIATSRSLVGSQAFSQNALGKRGTYFFVRFKAFYANGTIFQDVSLEKVDGDWKVAAFSFSPAPQ